MPERDRTPEQWAEDIYTTVACSPKMEDMLRVRKVEAILAQGKQQERKRIVTDLVEARLLKADKPLAHRKPTHGPCCTCQTCGHHHDDCVCNYNELLRIVNPDAKE